MKKIIVSVFALALIIMFSIPSKSTIIDAGPGKIWVGPDTQCGVYVTHTQSSNGDVTVYCYPDQDFTCAKIVNDGHGLELYDIICPPSSPDDITVDYSKTDG